MSAFVTRLKLDYYFSIFLKSIMNKNILRVFLILLFGLLTFSVPVSARINDGYKSYTDIGPLERSGLTISGVVSDPDKYNKEVITIDGRVSGLKYKKFINGKKFTLFNLIDDNKILKVYGRGFIDEIKDGSVVRIYGRYSKKKNFFLTKHKNVMKARKVFILNS